MTKESYTAEELQERSRKMNEAYGIYTKETFQLNKEMKRTKRSFNLDCLCMGFLGYGTVYSIFNLIKYLSNGNPKSAIFNGALTVACGGAFYISMKTSLRKGEKIGKIKEELEKQEKKLENILYED